MSWLKNLRMRYWRWLARNGYRPALMSLDMQGRLTTDHTPRAVLLKHYSREVAAAGLLARALRRKADEKRRFA